MQIKKMGIGKPVFIFGNVKNDSALHVAADGAAIAYVHISPYAKLCFLICMFLSITRRDFLQVLSNVRNLCRGQLKGVV